MNETSAGKTWALAAMAAAFVALLVIIFVFHSSKPDVIPAPKTFVPYTAIDNSFTVDEPAGWAAESSAAGSVNSGALFSRGDARIDISTDLAGSLYGDIEKAGPGASGVPMGALNAVSGGQIPNQADDQKPPVEKLHEQGEAAMKQKLGDYKEQPYQTFDGRLGEGCYSEFTANGGLLAGKLHGYRVTMLTSERRVTIICDCPESSWKNLKPAFDHVIDSFQAKES